MPESDPTDDTTFGPWGSTPSVAVLPRWYQSGPADIFCAGIDADGNAVGNCVIAVNITDGDTDVSSWHDIKDEAGELIDECIHESSVGGTILTESKKRLYAQVIKNGSLLLSISRTLLPMASGARSQKNIRRVVHRTYSPMVTM
ncbi:MAG: hypothetical protein M1827_007724 [Pycnora praestabilis]|nr:MAG: hypothetical protein M1827_007724 [Pycnora praestabilis]